MASIESRIDRAQFSSVAYTRIETLDWSAEAQEILAAQCDDWTDAGERREFWGTNEDGDEWRIHLTMPELPEDAVIVEVMPLWCRASHRAARSWGAYPANGAERVIMSRADAEDACAGDEDEYDHIVRDAKSSDLGKYRVES